MVTGLVRYHNSVHRKGVEEGEASRFRVTAAHRTAVLACHQARLRADDPPNALSGLAACAAAGALRVEVDVTFTADDVPVLSHDEMFLVGGRRMPARAVSADQIPGVVRLAEAVDALAGRGCVLQVDLKRRGPITPGEVAALADAVRPLGPSVIVGSQAHWNLRAIAEAGLTVAFDPTLHFRYVPRSAPGWWAEGVPRRTGAWGFRDDAAYAADRGWEFDRYLGARLDDLVALVPSCVELMVDIGTVMRIGELGVALGEELGRRGVALAVWTIRRCEGDATAALVARLLELGASTIITDVPLELGEVMRARVTTGHDHATGSLPTVPGSAVAGRSNVSSREDGLRKGEGT